MNQTYLQLEYDPYGSDEIIRLHMLKANKSYLHFKNMMNEYLPVIKRTTT